MGRRQRIVFAVVAILIAVVAGVALSATRDEKAERADAPPAATPSSQETPSPGQAELEPRSTPTATASPAATPPTPTIRVSGGEPSGGIKRIEVDKGDRVAFSVLSDTADEIHVHGYDLEKEVVPGKATRFSFPATIDGIFEVELHSTDDQIAELRVDP